MSKQQKTYLLVVAVAFVWGLIGYRIYTGLNPTSEKNTTTISHQTFIPKNVKKEKTYQLKANYRDPFLGKFSNQKNRKKRRKTTQINTSIPFPTVIYNGIVEGGNQKSYTVTVNGKQELLKIGQSIQEVKLLKANSNQITVWFNGVSKIIKLH